MAQEAVVVVFGCRHYEEYAARVDKAICLVLEKKLDPIFIFTGNDSPPWENVIKTFGNDRILWENVSRTTQENIKNTFEEIRRNWLAELPVYWVSSWYHFPKIKLFLHRAGLSVKRETFVKSYSEIALINVLIEPFALFAAYTGISRWPIFRKAKLALGYDV